MRQGEEYKTLSKGAAVNFIGQMFRLSRALSLVLFARFLGAKDFGLYFLVWSLTEIVQNSALFGLHGGALWFASDLAAQGKREQIRPAVLKIFAAGTLFGITAVLFVFFLGPWITTTFLKRGDLFQPWLIFSLTTPFYIGSRILGNALRATLKMHYEVWIYYILEPAVILVVGATTLMAGLGLTGCVIAHLVAAFAGWILALALFFKVYRNWKEPGTFRPTSKIFRYSFYLGGVDLLRTVKQRLDLLVLGHFLTLEAVGIYGALSEVGFTLRKIRDLFDSILLPIISHLRVLKDKERLRKQFVVTIRWILIVALGFYGVLVIAPAPILKIFGATFEIGGGALLVFALGELFHATLGLVECDLQMAGRSNIVFWNWMATLIINFLLLYWLVPLWGLMGAATATAATLIAMSFVRVLQVKKLHGFFPFHFSQGKVLIAAVAAFLICYFLPLPKGIVVALYLALYLFFLKLFGLEKAGH